jgi:UPF0755 protein|tara:strand:+ start:972 stop:1928 length:957 start_codon:yes stop_codon:yes gene_type:complete
LEEQIQRYCFHPIKKKLFIFFFLLFLLASFFFKASIYEEKIIEIEKGTSISEISSLILYDKSFFYKKLFKTYLQIYNLFFDNIKYGEFKLNKNSSLIEIVEIISKPSNVFYKFTVIDGWQGYQLENYMKSNFGVYIKIDYQDILADTYKYKSTDTLDKIIKLMQKNKDQLFSNYKGNTLLNEYSVNEIMTIASLVEREGINDNDKRLISSVIFNRFKKNMKLQIDASTIFSITGGKFKFGRKLEYNDLRINDIYNTYFIYGLPPYPICYVGRKTIEIVLENYKSEFLYYFFNNELNKHVFSKSYQEHKNKLNKYRLKN